MRKILVFALLIFGAFACDKDSESIESELKEVSFTPNQCSELWDTEKYNTDGSVSRENRFKNYLKDKGILSVSNLEVTTSATNGFVCKACTCPGDKIFKFQLTFSDFEKLKTIEPFSTYLK
jgi:hypothetical protein